MFGESGGWHGMLAKEDMMSHYGILNKLGLRSPGTGDAETTRTRFHGDSE